MKKLIARNWGIVLILFLLIGMLTPAVPVTAGDTAWSTITTPSAAGAKITANTNISFLEMAADGTTMFTYDNNNKILRKSVNSGLTWSTASLGTGLNGKTLTAFSISSGYASDHSLIAADFNGGAAAVYISTDGGSNWVSPINLSVAPAVNTVKVVSATIGPDYGGGSKVLIGTADGAGGGALYSWLSRTYTLTAELSGDTLAAALSPNFPEDTEVLAVTANATATILRAKLSDDAWTASSANVTFPGIAANANLKAVVAFGSDYDSVSEPYVLVGFNGSSADDLWRARVGDTPSVAVDLNIGGASTNTAVSSIDVQGEISDGTVYVGYSASAGVAKAIDITDSPVWTTASAKYPSGTGNTLVKAAANGVVTGTSGVGSAICLSTDNGATFNQMSMISFSSLGIVNLFTDLKVADSNTLFLVAQDPTAVYGVVFKSTDGGATWWGVFNSTASTIFGVLPSPSYGSDNTVFVPLKDNLWVNKSANGGSSFSTAIVGGTAPMTSFAAVDGSNYFAGSTGGDIYKSGRFVSHATLPDGESASSIVLGAGDILAAGIGGNVYRSSDDGLNFTPLGASGLGAGVLTVALDPGYASNGVIYIGNAASGVKRYTTLYTSIDTGASAFAASLVVSNDGNLYYGGAPITFGTAGTIRRALDPAALSNADQGWDNLQALPQSALPSSACVQKLGIVNSLISGTAYRHDVYALVNGVTPSAPDYNYLNRVVVFSDKLTNSVGITGPVEGATVPIDQTIGWAEYAGIPAGITVRYDVQLAQDSAFTQGLQWPASMTGTFWAGAALDWGQTYYVRVRVATGFPLVSKWSDTVSFSVAASGPANKLTFVQQPTNTTAGATMTPGVTVAVSDAAGNTVTSSTTAVTLDFSTNPAGGTLTGTRVINAVNGVATFGDLSIDKAGSGYILKASASGLTDGTSSLFNISAGPANRLAFSAQPGGGLAGAAISPQPAVGVEDALGNIVSSDNTTQVTLAITDGSGVGGAVLSGTKTMAVTGGMASFSGLNINLLGTGYTLTATSLPGLTAATSNPFAISGAGPAVTLQPVDQNVSSGATASFAASASGAPVPTVQWQTSINNGATWNDVSGATTNTLTVTGATASQNGSKYRAVFSNSLGSANSNAATLIVTVPVSGGGGLVGGGGSPPPAGAPGYTDISEKSGPDGTFYVNTHVFSADQLASVLILAGNTGLTAGGAKLTQITILPQSRPAASSDALITAYDFGPYGAFFSRPVTITLKYDPALLPTGTDQTKLYVARWDVASNSWVSLSSVVDTAAHSVTASVDYFSLYALMAPRVVVPAPMAAAGPLSTLPVLPSPAVITPEIPSPTTAVNSQKSPNMALPVQADSNPQQTSPLGQTNSQASLSPAVSYSQDDANTRVPWILGIAVGALVAVAVIVMAVRRRRES